MQCSQGEELTFKLRCMKHRVIIASENGTLYNFAQEDLGSLGSELSSAQTAYVKEVVGPFAGGLSHLDLDDSSSRDRPPAESEPEVEATGQKKSKFYIFNCPSVRSPAETSGPAVVNMPKEIPFKPPEYPFVIIADNSKAFKLGDRSFAEQNTWQPELRLELMAKYRIQDLMNRGLAIARTELYDFFEIYACACAAFNCASFFDRHPDSSTKEQK